MSLQSIPTEKIINGIKKAFENAESFLNEVYILKEYEAWAHSYTLCQLAIEELSKIPMLFQLWMDKINGHEIDYKTLDSDFRNHIVKTELSVKLEIGFFKLYKKHTGSDSVDDAIKKAEKFLENIKQSNDLKNESLYITVKNSDFQSPSEIITKEIFDSIYGTALLRKMLSENLLRTEDKIEEIAKYLKNNAENRENNKSS